MLKKIIYSCAAVCLFLLPSSAHGQSLSESVNTQLNAGANKAGFSTTDVKDPRLVVADTIKEILSLLGMVFIVLVVIAGYWYLTAGGEEDKVDKAKKTIAAATIGITIVLAAYSITAFVAKRIQNSVQEQKVYDVQTGPAPFAPGGSKKYDVFNFDASKKE